MDFRSGQWTLPVDVKDLDLVKGDLPVDIKDLDLVKGNAFTRVVIIDGGKPK